MTSDPTRTICENCALKHVSGARIVFLEMLNGYHDKPNHLVDFVGDMYAAEKHAGAHTDLAADIRLLRTHVTDLFLTGEIGHLRENGEAARPLIDRFDDLGIRIAERLRTEASEFEHLAADSGRDEADPEEYLEPKRPVCNSLEGASHVQYEA